MPQDLYINEISPRMAKASILPHKPCVVLYRLVGIPYRKRISPYPLKDIFLVHINKRFY